ncbi:hypothetical protein CPB83DRAFT_896002 [Crepidotus variabilis]|uniref:Homeobox domain-containing protein n=1 Tax=Crepidotus variabilis TaxID=179855 RepID=A0A9P6JNI9_9AGAR|nr:hypothetical protein CPB83DRAFT_896002 [Crepidotus variabilis]
MGFHSHLYSRPLVPNTQDPAAVDFRAFYPYTPNEVKHRKRTTNQQLKVLEAIFKKDTKPNAQLRQELAQELNMTPRGVQVWFQNRRAKEKSKSVKGGKAGMAGPSGNGGGAEEDETCTSSANSPMPVKDELSSSSANSDGVSDDMNDLLGMTSRSPSVGSGQPTPHVSSPPQLHVRTDASTLRTHMNKSPIEGPPDSATSYTSAGFPPASTAVPPPSAFNQPRFGSGMGLTSEELYSLRRGSLPVFPASPAFGQRNPPQADLSSYDPLVRRGSVDASLQRLANNPFAPLARAKNSALYGAGVGVSVPGLNPSSGPIHSGAAPSNRYHPVHNRMAHGQFPLQRRNPSSSITPEAAQLHSSAPQHAANLRRFSMDARATRIAATQRVHHSASPSPLTPYNAVVRASLPEPHLYSITARPVASPIPGPLPAPGFQFGAASSASPSSADSERNSPDSPKSFTFGGEDDGQTSPLYGSYSSRFGSVASIATSESSINSSFYAELGGSAIDHTERRDSSCAPPAQFLSVYAEVDASNQADHVHHGGPVSALDNMYSSHEEYSGFTPVHQQQDSQIPGHQASNYPSPTSTISARGSPGQTATMMAMNSSSALAYALDEKLSDQKSIHPSHHPQEAYTNFATGEHSVNQNPQTHIHQPQEPYFGQHGQAFQQESPPYPPTFAFGGSQPTSDYGVFATDGNYSDPLGPPSVLESGPLESFVAYS